MKLSDHTIQGFLFEGDHSTEYQESLKNDYSAVLMGRKTYECGLQFRVKSPYPWLNQYVVSKSMESDPDPAVKLVSGDPVKLTLAGCKQFDNGVLLSTYHIN